LISNSYWNNGTNQLQIKMEDTKDKIIKAQGELIDILKENLKIAEEGKEIRDRMIAMLERQLERAEKFIIAQHEQQQK
jgi:hypothetical protein